MATLVVMLASSSVGVGAERAQPALRSESFDKDPRWEGHNNRIVPKEYPTIVQDFGYSETHHAGEAAGKMGGQVWRASEPAYYAERIGPRTLNDALSASGTFALAKSSGSSGVFFGFFRAEQPGAGGRPVRSLGLDLDGERSGARLAVRLITARNQSCGTFVTPFIPGKFRPTPIRNDGTRYAWKLDYDPQGAAGRGRLTFVLTSDAHHAGELETSGMPETYRREARSRFPSTTAFSVDLPDGFKTQGTTFDHFGLMNMMKAGGRMSIYFDDLRYEGRSQDFAVDPKWDASGNQRTYRATDVGGAHNFGFSSTSFAGGKPGELGGTFWRGGAYGYYADRVGPLTLEDHLEASGKVLLQVGAPDSDMYLGWFNSAYKESSPAEAGNFISVHIGGPTRVGHYFAPSLCTAKGTRARAESAPVLEPGKACEWSLAYDPGTEDGRGSIRVMLGGQSVTLALKKGVRAQSASFDRFGVFTAKHGGQVVRIFFDDLKYSSAR